MDFARGTYSSVHVLVSAWLVPPDHGGSLLGRPNQRGIVASARGGKTIARIDMLLKELPLNMLGGTRKHSGSSVRSF